MPPHATSLNLASELSSPQPVDNTTHGSPPLGLLGSPGHHCQSYQPASPLYLMVPVEYVLDTQGAACKGCVQGERVQGQGTACNACESECRDAQ